MARRKRGMSSASHYLGLMQMFSDTKKKAGMHHVSVRGPQNHPFAPQDAGATVPQDSLPAYAPGPKEMATEGKLKLLFGQLAHQSHLHGAQIRDEANISVAPEGEGTYQPLAVAEPSTHSIVFNQASPALQRVELDQGGVPIGTPAPGATDQNYQEGVVAHETGHLFEPQLLQNRNGVDRYTDQVLGTKARAPYWLENSPQGRTEVRANPDAILQRDPTGMPTNGAGSAHTAPNEMYANDAGAAMGHPFTDSVRSNHPKHDPNYVMAHASRKVLTKLIAQGLLPKGGHLQKDWHPRGR